MLSLRGVSKTYSVGAFGSGRTDLGHRVEDLLKGFGESRRTVPAHGTASRSPRRSRRA